MMGKVKTATKILLALLSAKCKTYKAANIISQRGPIKPGFFADIIAVPGNPLVDIDALRNVRFVMKNGMVFKKDGVMVPEKFFHPGPVKTPNGRWSR